MFEPWNDASILPPPVNMFLCAKKVDVSALKHICNSIIKVLSKQSPLHKESALCSRFIYKYDRKFRNDIGYRNLRKVHTALKKYLALNLLKDVENFLSALPSEADDEKYLPTRQMLEYLMLRIITFSMIMLRICVCSKQAAIFYLNRLKRGESHWMSLLPYALLSRLWSMTMVLVQHSTTWYSNLYPYLSKLEVKGLNFLQENYQLPEDLEKLLDLKNIDCFGKFDWDQKKLIDVDNALLVDDDENDLFDNILRFVNNSNRNESEEEIEEEFKLIDKCKVDTLNIIPTVTKIDQGEVLSRDSYKMDQGTVLSRESFRSDQGEALSRESFKVLNSQNNDTKEHAQLSHKRNKPSKQNKEHPHKVAKQAMEVFVETNKIKKENNEHTYNKVTNAQSLKQFIDREEVFRNASDSRSLTDHLSLMQWHALKKASLKLCDALTNRKIERKFQKIWKEKCLDYE